MNKREFPYQVTRIGNTGSKYFTPVQCCRCGREKVFEAIKALPDEIIAKRFRSWGWVIGRNRQNDICPVCIGVRPENKLAERFKVTVGDQPVPTRAEVAEKVEAKQEATRKSIQAGLLKLTVYKDISEDLRKIRESLEQIALAMSLAVDVMYRKEEGKKAPTKKARASRKKKPEADGSELGSEG